MSLVSIIVPCYNEQKTIGLLLAAIDAQTLPREQIEVIIADGMSTDRTREVIAEFSAAHPALRVRVVDNLKRNIPAGVNAALRMAESEYIVRMDAHSVPEPEYVERCVADLQAGLGENVGGVWQIEPGGTGWVARAIARAAAHPLGVGDAGYRYTTRAGLVDTVPFGAFRRDLVERIGGFDESLLSNEDYEFNTRVRQSGGRVYLDPQIRTVYFARSTLGALASQYWRYGLWKWRMLRRYPSTLRWRQALPPLFVLSLIGLAVLSLFWPVARWALLAEALIYLGALVGAALPAAVRAKDAGLLPGMPLAIGCMHLCWGSGFLWSAITSMLERKN